MARISNYSKEFVGADGSAPKNTLIIELLEKHGVAGKTASSTFPAELEKLVEIAKVKIPSPKPQPIYLKVFSHFKPISEMLIPQTFIAIRVAIIQQIFVITLSAIIV